MPYYKRSKLERRVEVANTPALLLLPLVAFAVIYSVAIGAYVLAWISLGYLVHWMAARKGRAHWAWFVYGACVFPVAVIHIALKKPTSEARHVAAASGWATDDPSVCGYRDGYAPGPCVKRRGHHLLGLDRSPHDFRAEARGLD